MGRDLWGGSHISEARCGAPGICGDTGQMRGFFAALRMTGEGEAFPAAGNLFNVRATDADYTGCIA